MRKSFIVLALAAVLVLLSASAWAASVPPPSLEDWENWAAYPGPIVGQTSGSGWANGNQNFWNGAPVGDPAKRTDVVSLGGQFLALYGTSTPNVTRNFNEAFFTQDFTATLDYWIYKVSYFDSSNIYLSDGDAPGVQIDFQNDYRIRARGAQPGGNDVTIGYWDGRDKDGVANDAYNFAEGFRQIKFDVDFTGKTYDLSFATIGGQWQSVGTYNWRESKTQLNHIKFLGSKSNSMDVYQGATCVDNIKLVPEPPILLGDANNDRVVDDEDASILGSHWLQPVSGGWRDGDFNTDGVVDDRDAAILAAHWGSGAEGNPAVPEPATLTLLVAGLAMLAGQKLLRVGKPSRARQEAE